MHLVIQFDCREHSTYTLEEFGLAAGGDDHHELTRCWGLNYGSFGGMCGELQSFSRLLGKRAIPPLPKEKSGFWGFAEEEVKQHVEFIIGVNDHGANVSHTSDPDALANYFGANPGAPHYLTPVHFRKTVLDKYYQQPGKYTVGDSVLWCGRLWCMYIDNHHDDKVCAWLGDLGRDLTYEEQLHWRSHNIAPVGSVSKTFFRRQMMAEFADSDRPEHLFHEKYGALIAISRERLGWPLLLPLSPEDAHFAQSIRVPSTDEQKDFDDLVLGLTKMLIDSLNEQQLNALIPPGAASGVRGGIAKLEAALSARAVDGFAEHIRFLRKLQSLRSTGSAHRKGSNYQKIAAEFGVESDTLRSVFGGILRRAIELLNHLKSVVTSGKLLPGETAQVGQNAPDVAGEACN